MYLKSLQLHGFKSFAEKIEIEFSQGMTVVVGPNGCGKSNVVDAIRWVLGETSAKALRGTEMSDVIFNGTDERKAYGMAEVTLSFSHCEEVLGSDFHEVSLTRRVYRDGISEYYFNQNKCRLKDIQDLFMNTGLGISCYSIMEQGKIDLLLSAKPEERRIVFEEAAGITKFKKERKIALIKLEQTEVNLLRISELLQEQERRIRSLKQQKKKAQLYREFDEASRLFYICYARRQNISFNEASHSHQKSLQACEKKINEFHLKEEEKENASLKIQKTLSRIEEEINSFQEVKNTTKADLAKIENQILLNKERSSEWQNMIEASRKEIEQMKQSVSDEKEEIETLQVSKSINEFSVDEKNQLSQLEKSLQNAQFSTNEAQEQFSEAKRKIEETKNTIKEIQFNLEKKEQTLSINTKREQKQKLQKKEKEENLIKIKAEIEKLSKSFLESKKNCEFDSQKIESLEKILKEQKESISLLSQKKKKMADELSKKEGKLLALQSSIQSRKIDESFQESSVGKKIKGQLLNLIEVKEPYFMAIEAFLADKLNMFVVKNSESCSDLLKFLQTNKKGKFSFLIEEFFNENKKLLNPLPRGAECMAIDCLKISENQFSPLINQIFANVAIVENYQIALNLRKTFSHFTFVTKQGEILYPNGIFIGGRIDSLLGLIKEEKFLSQSFKQDQFSFEQVERKLQKSEDKKGSIIKEIEEINGALLQKKKAHQEIEFMQESEKERRNFLLSEIIQIEEQTNDFLQEKEQFLANKEEEKINLNSQKQNLDSLLEGFQEKDLRVQECLSFEKDLSKKVDQLKIKLELIENTKQVEFNEILMARKHKEELQKLIQSRKESITHNKNRIEQAFNQNQSLQLEEEKLQNKIIQIDSSSVKSINLKKKTEEEKLSLHQDLKEIQNETSSLLKRKSKDEIELEKIRLQREQLNQNLKERYQLDEVNSLDIKAEELNSHISKQRSLFLERGLLEEFLKEDSEEKILSEKDLQFGEDLLSIVSDLRVKMNKLGGVNMEAIEEYEELEERCSVVRNQCEDLKASKQNLLELIEKLNSESIEKFTKTFEQAKENFKEVFQQLFGRSAKAYISLIDEENPLESGIDIIVRPPGKKLQKISLLSGGEKSMTAVALLFAIYKVKPSPFCILDELDAPLDDANVARFLGVLANFLQEGQFVIITHNKKTMQAADFIYGITMDEPGISRLIGMSFERGKLQSIA